MARSIMGVGESTLLELMALSASSAGWTWKFKLSYRTENN